jgi:hypothetical protein
MANLTFFGGYFRYEIQQIDEEDAKNYIENGIDDLEIDDLDFSDEAEQGLSGEIVAVLDGEKVAEFDLQAAERTSIEPIPSYWHALKLEHGRRGTSYSIELTAEFDVKKIEIRAEIKKVGNNEYRFTSPSYDSDSGEYLSERVDEVEFFIVSPEGRAYPLNIN